MEVNQPKSSVPKSKKCPACGKLTPATGAFCTYCGAALKKVKVVLIEDEERKETCPFCGKLTSVNVRFCEHCDSYLGNEWLSNHGIGKGEEKKLFESPAPISKKFVSKEKICCACGARIDSRAIICPQCKNMADTQVILGISMKKPVEDKTVIGIVCALFLGLIGLIIGLVLYEGEERESFLSGWIKTFIITSIVAVILTIIIVSIAMSCYKNLVDDLLAIIQ